MNRWKDTLGIIASVACAVHCAATPLLLLFLPALKFTEWMASPQFHQVAALICVGIVSISIWPTFRRFRDYRVLSLSTAGLSLLLGAAFLLPDECCSHTHAELTQSSSGFSKLVSVSESTNSDHDHADHDHAAHDHSSHDHASHDHSSHASETTIAGVTNSPWFAKIQPWMTPLGGLLLVIAHTLNLRRRFSACGPNCGCSHSDSESTRGIPIPLVSNPKAA